MFLRVTFWSLICFYLKDHHLPMCVLNNWEMGKQLLIWSSHFLSHYWSTFQRIIRSPLEVWPLTRHFISSSSFPSLFKNQHQISVSMRYLNRQCSVAFIKHNCDNYCLALYIVKICVWTKQLHSSHKMAWCCQAYDDHSFESIVLISSSRLQLCTGNCQNKGNTNIVS
jgi:hypothetical protein